MHRSGTSLVCSLLQSAGLDIGRRLSSPNPGNVRGYFEDLDFNELHMELLQSQGLPPNGYTLQQDFPVREGLLLRALALVGERRKAAAPWGWKDPRTTLFLDFWRRLIPESRFLLLYRPPWEVVDSLFRRGDEAFCSHPGFAVRLWMHYNQLLLAFHDRHPSYCLLVNSHRAALAPALLLDALYRKLNLRLGRPADLFEESLFHHCASSRWPSLFQRHFPEAVALYEELYQRSRRGCPRGEGLAGAAAPCMPPAEEVLQDWLNFRVVERHYKALQAEQEKVESQLNQAQAEAASLRAELERSRSELLAQLDASRVLISAMQSSKFWKLRKAWFRAKGALRRAG
jgi:hypothetical protein